MLPGSAEIPGNGAETEERSQQVVCYQTGDETEVWMTDCVGEDLQLAYLPA